MINYYIQLLQQIYPGMGAVDIQVLVLDIEKKNVEVDGEAKTVFTGVLTILGTILGIFAFFSCYFYVTECYLCSSDLCL